MTGISSFVANKLLATAYFKLAAGVSFYQFSLDAVQLSADAATWKDYSSPLSAMIGSSNGALFVSQDTSVLSTVGDNQLHMVTTYEVAKDVTHLLVQYDTNSASGTTALSNVIAMDFAGDVTTTLVPASLTYTFP